MPADVACVNTHSAMPGDVARGNTRSAMPGDLARDDTYSHSAMPENVAREDTEAAMPGDLAHEDEHSHSAMPADVASVNTHSAMPGDVATANVHLPCEALTLIWDNLDSFRDKLALLAVCRSWRMALLQGSTHLTLGEDDYVCSAHVATVVARFSGLTALSLPRGSISCLSASFFQAVAGQPALKHLSIGAIFPKEPENTPVPMPQHSASVDVTIPTPESEPPCAAHAAETAELASAAATALFSSCTALQEVRMEGYVAPPGEFGKASGVPRAFPSAALSANLKSLRILHVGPRIFSLHSLAHLGDLPLLRSITFPADSGGTCATALKNLPLLEELNLLYEYPQCGNTFRLPSALSELRALTSLGIFISALDSNVLDYNLSELVDAFYEPLEEEFAKIPSTIRKLTISGLPTDLPRAVCNLQSLEELDLRSCLRIQALPSSIALLSSLRILRLTRLESMWLIFRVDGEDHDGFAFIELLGDRPCSLKEIWIQDCDNLEEHMKFAVQLEAYPGVQLHSPWDWR